jgi:adhesin transport system outer membrane protein
MAIGGFSAAIPVYAEITTYGQAISTALTKNPAVTAAYYEFEATREAQRVIQGRFLPSVDVTADYGWEDRETPINNFGEYDRDAVRFSITQMLFDGFQTRDEARAAGYDKLARYYDFDSASQQIALEATEAYLNTVLFQKLVGFAEENYVVHRQLFNKIAERAEGGVSQRVDLEQATARMALAESNLLTEVTNLHDTTAEFQRVVGDLPASSLALPKMPGSAIPALREEALMIAYERSPVVNSAVEDMRAAQESYNATEAPMLPRLDLRYRNEFDTNTDGFEGDYDLQAVELVFSYNLYRGGADSARRREFSNRYYSAMENRKQACLDVRRETMIAFNNVKALEQQVRYLQQQLEAQNKTRLAYNDQFDLGQRSLLDLLDSQNEYFDTQRSLVSAQTNLAAAQARTLANMGALTRALDAKGFNADKIDSLALQLDRGTKRAEAIGTCPMGAPAEIEIDEEAIFERLNQRADTTMGRR